jgi:hypothetical protein
MLLVSEKCNAICNIKAQKIINSYPEYLSFCKDNYIFWKNGEKQLFDDELKKTAKQLLENPDIEDMFRYEYKTGSSSYTAPSSDFDPGRIRNEEFFKRMYGKNKKSVEANLVKIQWISNQEVKIQKINNISKKLTAISNELNMLPINMKKYILDSAGTFNWRIISGTNRLSNHSFGIAIDINTKFSNYWLWNKNKYKYENHIPHKIVEIFEKYGFIWGGKWYHYDTMHFEYRPELL